MALWRTQFKERVKAAPGSPTTELSGWVEQRAGQQHPGDGSRTQSRGDLRTGRKNSPSKI